MTHITKLTIRAFTAVSEVAEVRRRDERGLTTVEWSLLVAGVAAIAIGLIVIIRQNVGDAAGNISTEVNVDETLPPPQN